jgi:hypothetical protein
MAGTAATKFEQLGVATRGAARRLQQQISPTKFPKRLDIFLLISQRDEIDNIKC